MKDITIAVGLWLGGFFVGLGTGFAVAPAAADARPIHHTARVDAPTHTVRHHHVTTVYAVTVHDGPRSEIRMLRFRMNDGSSWLSPDPSCEGRRHNGCQAAWERYLHPESTFHPVQPR